MGLTDVRWRTCVAPAVTFTKGGSDQQQQFWRALYPTHRPGLHKCEHPMLMHRDPNKSFNGSLMGLQSARWCARKWILSLQPNTLLSPCPMHSVCGGSWTCTIQGFQE